MTVHDEDVPVFGPDTLPLTRETVRRGLVRRMIARAGIPVRLLPEAEIDRRLEEALAARPERGDVWLFAYGSLIWNPMVEVQERRPVRIFGYHRRFCLETRIGRGTPERPGLMLGLDRGGSCQGVALRIAARHAREELAIVFHRELVTGAYRARWLRAHGPHGPLTVLAFVIDRHHERYVRALPHGRLVEILATARGPLGSAAAYLHDTTVHLRAFGIRDPSLERLCREVATRRRELGLCWPPPDARAGRMEGRATRAAE